MNILIIDDESISLEVMQITVKAAISEAEGNVFAFDSAKKGIEFAKSTKIDVAFLDIVMEEMSGIDLAKALKEICPEVNIIFQTSHAEYMPDAFSMYVSGYLIKPVKASDVKRALENLRHPVEISMPKRIRVRTFGNFEVFCDNIPIKFKNTKTKELFAYLIDRNGSGVTSADICAALWEDEDNASIRSYLRILIAELSSRLSELGVSDVFNKRRNNYSINPEAIECDLYDYLNGINMNKFLGEYMSQYYWGELTLAGLERISEE